MSFPRFIASFSAIFLGLGLAPFAMAASHEPSPQQTHQLSTLHNGQGLDLNNAPYIQPTPLADPPYELKLSLSSQPNISFNPEIEVLFLGQGKLFECAPEEMDCGSQAPLCADCYIASSQFTFARASVPVNVSDIILFRTESGGVYKSQVDSFFSNKLSVNHQCIDAELCETAVSSGITLLPFLEFYSPPQFGAALYLGTGDISGSGQSNAGFQTADPNAPADVVFLPPSSEQPLRLARANNNFGIELVNKPYAAVGAADIGGQWVYGAALSYQPNTTFLVKRADNTVFKIGVIAVSRFMIRVQYDDIAWSPPPTPTPTPTPTRHPKDLHALLFQAYDQEQP